MKFQNFFRFFVGRVVWGVCHFDTKPHFFPEAPCQNDIPPFMIGYHNSDM